MPAKRTYTDAQLSAAVAAASSWGDVMELLGRGRSNNRQYVMKTAQDLGLDIGHLDGVPTHQTPIAAPGPHLFPARESKGHGKHGLATACTWFLTSGYNVSIPLESAPYDLVAESVAGLQRVQVKTCSYTSAAGRYMARIQRVEYDANRSPNRHGSYRATAYTKEQIDFFFIVTANGGLYLIPVEAVHGAKGITLDDKYAAFRLD